MGDNAIAGPSVVVRQPPSGFVRRLSMKRKLSFLSLAICIFLSLAQLSYAEEKPQPSTIEVVGKARVSHDHA